MLIESITFKNFGPLRDTTLPLGQFSLLVGPNASGKSTAMRGVRALSPEEQIPWSQLNVTADSEKIGTSMSIKATIRDDHQTLTAIRTIERSSRGVNLYPPLSTSPPDDQDRMLAKFNQIRLFALDPRRIEATVTLEPTAVLGPGGDRLAGVLDRIRDEHPERFDAINSEMTRLLPEFDRILFATPHSGHRSIQLRQKTTRALIPATSLSDGTLVALALLTLVYLPEPPSVICIEEPDQHLHPRLLRDVKNALYRLAYPQDFGEDRQPVQVIATTHSPYMLDLFRDHPQEIVIAQKIEDNVTFERLSDRKDVKAILQDTPLGEAWYSGILGGVPSGT